MDIYEFCGLVSDDSIMVAIWDYSADDEIFRGALRDAAYDFGSWEVFGIDITPPDQRGVSVVLNVDSRE